ncbi:uncharacterized protein [Ptychodera flava]|uniref:uncharacterized protein isoform X3 n=1 Tax=Ptychodera flava TaxID=63121 RepID=UPI00396A8212
MGKKYAKTSRKERYKALSRVGRAAKRRRICYTEGNPPSTDVAAEPSEEGTTTRPDKSQPSSQSSTFSANVDVLSTQSGQETSEEEPKPSTSKAGTDISGTCRSKQIHFDPPDVDTMGIQSSDPISGGAETTDFSSDTEYFPLPNKRHLLYRPIVLHVDTAVPKAVPVDDCFYVGQSSCISDFMENINRTSHCRTDGCSGILILVKVTTAGLGGSLKIDYSCNGCTGRNISFDNSMYIEDK